MRCSISSPLSGTRRKGCGALEEIKVEGRKIENEEEEVELNTSSREDGGGSGGEGRR